LGENAVDVWMDMIDCCCACSYIYIIYMYIIYHSVLKRYEWITIYAFILLWCRVVRGRSLGGGPARAQSISRHIIRALWHGDRDAYYYCCYSSTAHAAFDWSRYYVYGGKPAFPRLIPISSFGCRPVGTYFRGQVDRDDRPVESVIYTYTTALAWDRGWLGG